MILRKLTVDDLNFLIEVRNDESTRKFLENDARKRPAMLIYFVNMIIHEF